MCRRRRWRPYIRRLKRGQVVDINPCAENKKRGKKKKRNKEGDLGSWVEQSTERAQFFALDQAGQALDKLKARIESAGWWCNGERPQLSLAHLRLESLTDHPIFLQLMSVCRRAEIYPSVGFWQRGRARVFLSSHRLKGF